MFYIPRANVVESDAGFSVEILGPTGLLYKEGDRSIYIDSEILAGPSGLLIFSGSIKDWQSEHGDKPINATDRVRIAANLQAAFKFRGFVIEVI